MSEKKNLLKFFINCLLIGLWFLLLLFQDPGDGLGTDYYPIYRAGRQLLQGVNPYSQAEIEHYLQTWDVPFAAAGFAYPLPLVVGVLPLVLLPLKIGVLLWTAFGLTGAVSAIRLRQDWRPIILLPFLFMPLLRAATFHQATLLSMALVPIMIFAMRRKYAWLAGWCIVMLPTKPQAGLLFSLAGLLWAWREQRKVLGWTVFWGFLIWGGSFLLEPGWLQGWLHSLHLYNDIVTPVSFLPWSLILIILTWRLPWYARLAAIQVALFPATDAYSALPLLLTWVGIGGNLALVGSALSWLWVIFALPNTAIIFWLLILLPLGAACLVRWGENRWRLPGRVG